MGNNVNNNGGSNYNMHAERARSATEGASSASLEAHHQMEAFLNMGMRFAGMLAGLLGGVLGSCGGCGGM